MSMQLSEGYTAAILISGTEPFTTEHESIEQAREWLTATLTGLIGGSDSSFADQQCSALIVDNISDRTIDQWDGGAAQVAAALRGEAAPNLARVDAGDPQWAEELRRPYITDPQVHSEIGGQYVTFTYRDVRWLIVEDMSGDTAALVLSRDFKLTYDWAEGLPDVEAANHYLYVVTVRDAVNEAIQIIDNLPL